MKTTLLIKKSLIKKFGTPYSKQLGINLKTKKGRFKWFLASILFGAPIQESCAIKTYKCFIHYGIDSPKKILKTGWHGLVGYLDEGSYTRYDYKTADKLLEVMKNLSERYRDIDEIHKVAENSKDLENRIKELGKGIGDITVNIFLRELRVIWKKADPEPSPLVKFAAKKLNIKLPKNRKTKRFICMESALIRLSRFLKKGKSIDEIMKKY